MKGFGSQGLGRRVLEFGLGGLTAWRTFDAEFRGLALGFRGLGLGFASACYGASVRLPCDKWFYFRGVDLIRWVMVKYNSKPYSKWEFKVGDPHIVL